MVLRCCHPNCTADFVHLYEAEWIVIELPNRTRQCYWLCGACAPRFHLVYDLGEGVTIVPMSPIKKSPGRERRQLGESPGKAA
jgi:hypothetical protein